MSVCVLPVLHLLVEQTPLSLQSAQRKTVVRSFFLPLERSKLGGGNVARMVRDIETSSTPSALHKKATIEPESLSSSSKLPMHQGNSLKVPTSDSDDENSKIHRFFAFVMEKVGSLHLYALLLNQFHCMQYGISGQSSNWLLPLVTQGCNGITGINHMLLCSTRSEVQCWVVTVEVPLPYDCIIPLLHVQLDG